MSFYSILFPTKEKEIDMVSIMPEALSDLRLDQFFGFIFEEKKKYSLEEYYFTMLKDIETITYRQEVLKDLLNPAILNEMRTFSEKTGALKKSMDNIRATLKLKVGLENNYLTKGALFEKALVYTEALEQLYKTLDQLPLKSKGLLLFKEYVLDYFNSSEFKKLDEEVNELRKRFDSIEYCMYIKGTSIRVQKYQDEDSLTDEITETFKKFREDSVKSYSKNLIEAPEEKRIEIEIIQLVSKLYPQEFKSLEKFCIENENFDNDVLLRFSKEIQFYIGWIEGTELLRGERLKFNIPEVVNNKESLYLNDFFDIMLATKNPQAVVPNSITLSSPERILVITGPNQGGKTTFARAFGQAHYLASLGLDIPGSSSKIYLADQILTHFEKEESIETLNGKLLDELERLHQLKEKATKDSIIIINEIFASTTTKDAIELGFHMMDFLSELMAISVVVTFLDELSMHGEETVSLMTTIESEDSHKRTYKIIRKKADGHAFAFDIQKKYSLTSIDLERRLKR